MARHALKTADGEGFLRAFTDEWKDVEMVYKVTLDLQVRPSERKGVIVHHITARLANTPPEPYPQASVRLEYPSSQVQSYEAFLYALAVKLARVLDMQQRYPEGKR